MIIPLFAILAFQFPAGESPERNMGQQMKTLLAETEDSIPIYLEMFKNGINADVLVKLGDEFLQYSKPEQALRCYQVSLKLKPKHAKALEGSKKSKARADELFARINDFQEKKVKEKNYQYGCRSSAILFYLGRREEALDMLRNLAKEFGPNNEMAGLMKTFKEGHTIHMNTERLLSREFVKAVEEKNLDLALGKFAHLIFLSLGEVPSETYMERINAGFAEKVNAKKILKAADLLVQENS